jgi:4a-hydroxytetrahydrobiopterin dehydratase
MLQEVKMQVCDLTKKKCKPCEGGVPPLGKEEVKKLLGEVRSWTLNGKTIEKEFSFKDFVAAMKFVNQVAEIAEEEGHHPDLFIHYNRVKVILWTHAVDGLTENDFIEAAKIDVLVSG